jgi:hypothetical protein
MRSLSDVITEPNTVDLEQIHNLQGQLNNGPAAGDLLELAMAVAISPAESLEQGLSPVWLLISGPPSIGKSESLLALRGATGLVYVDTLTDNALASGYISPRTGQPGQASLLQGVHEKCLVVKDLTTVFSLRQDKVKKLLGDLLVAFDGQYAKATGTLGVLEFECRFALLACITSQALAKHQRYMSVIGNRFLAYEVPPLTEAMQTAALAQCWALRDKRGKTLDLRKRVQSYLTTLRTAKAGQITMAPPHQRCIDQLARLIARGRVGVYASAGQRVSEESEYVSPEQPFRVHEQLRVLAASLARVHDRTTVTDHELEMLRRVAISSLPADRAEILRLLPEFPDGMTRESCARAINRSPKQATRRLNELVAAGVLVAAASGHYRPVAEFAELLYTPSTNMNHRNDLELAIRDTKLPQEDSAVAPRSGTGIGAR